MVIAQFAPAPSRRNRGGLPAGCSAIILVWSLVLAPQAFAASSPSPDPARHVSPDAAPTNTAPTTGAPQTTQQPASQSPVATPPSTIHTTPTTPATGTASL